MIFIRHFLLLSLHYICNIRISKHSLPKWVMSAFSLLVVKNCYSDAGVASSVCPGQTGTTCHFVLWLRWGKARPGEAWGIGQASRLLPAWVLWANTCVHKD